MTGKCVALVMLVLLCVTQVSAAGGRMPRGKRSRSNVAVLSEVPLTVSTETKCGNAGMKRTSKSISSTNGNTYGAIQTMISTSSSSSSSSAEEAAAPKGGWVGLEIATPTTSFIFNIGPTLSNIGISDKPAAQDAQEQAFVNDDEDEDDDDTLDDVISRQPSGKDMFTVKRIMIEDGLNFTQVGESYPVMNLTMTSPIFNFTYGGLSDGTSEYTVCSLISGRNASEALIKTGTISTSASFSSNLEFQTEDERSDFYDSLFQSQPLGLSSGQKPVTNLYLSLVSPTGELSLVKARQLFTLMLPPQWMEELGGDVSPECRTKSCLEGDTSCLTNLEI